VITGLVLDADGQPVEGARVYANVEQWWGVFTAEPWTRRKPTAHLSITLAPPPEGPPVDWPAHAVLLTSIPVAAQIPTAVSVHAPLVDVVISLPVGTRLTGAAREGNGAVRADAEVMTEDWSANSESEASAAFTTTDDQGAFTLLLSPPEWLISSGSRREGTFVDVKRRPVPDVLVFTGDSC
jgi:hypothetical protein